MQARCAGLLAAPIAALAWACGGSPTPATKAAPHGASGGRAHATATLPPLDPSVVGQAFEQEPTVTDDGVVRVGWTRHDVRVTVDGTPLPPAAGLGTWAAFAPAPGGAMVMGETVVFEDEVDAAMDAAVAHGLEVTALHDHFLFDRPPVYFMHVGGMGDPAALAAAVREVWEAIRRVRAERPEPAEDFGGDAAVDEGTLDAEGLGEILGAEPTVNGGVVKLSWGREARMHGVTVGGSMGITTWAAFSGSDGAASVDGDFAMTAEEVQPVLRALRANGFHVVALHNHVVGGEPFYYFGHYWGTGPARTLAEGLRAVLEAQRAAGR